MWLGSGVCRCWHYYSPPSAGSGNQLNSPQPVNPGSLALEIEERSECTNINSSTLSEVRWVLGSESLEDGEEEEELLEKNNNDSQDRLDRVTGCVRCVQVPVRWTFQLTFPSLRFKDVGDGSDTQYLSSSDPNKYSTSKICPLLFF